MTQTAHSPLPWVIASKSGFPVIVSSRYDVATPSFAGVSYGKLKDRPDKAAEILANAEFIVRACNSHYELLEALKLVSSAIDDLRSQHAFDGGGFDSSKLDEAEQNAARVILKAEGRS